MKFPVNVIYKAGAIQNNLPDNFREEDRALFQRDLEIRFPESNLFLLKQVFVTDYGVIYNRLSADKTNIICYDSDFKNYRFRYFVKAFLTFKKFRYKGSKSIIVFDNYSGPNGFAHWICDGLTRLAEVENLHDYTLIVPAYFKDQALYADSLSLFGATRFYYLEPQSLTFFREVYFPSPIAETGNFRKENIVKLKERVNTSLGIVAKPEKNIYISRGKANRRFVQNEAAISELLQRYDFEVVYMEDHAFIEQIRLIASAKTVVSIHGAALTLAMFMAEGGNMVEFRKKDDQSNNMYYLLANAVGLHYYYLLCDYHHVSAHANNFNLEVDPVALETLLRSLNPSA
jgi:hypothetical protein